MAADTRRWFEDGVLCADVGGKVRRFARPCDMAAECGVESFLGSGRNWTGAARMALRESSKPFNPLRGEPDVFIMFMTSDDRSFSVGCMACQSMALTVRVEDAWALLTPHFRAYSYSCNIAHDHVGDAETPPDGVVTEKLHGIAPDARICIDVAENGGFLLEFHPEAQ